MICVVLLPSPESPAALPKKKISGELKPVLASAATFTSSHSFLMAFTFQVISTRSLPPVPPPRITDMAAGVGPVLQAPTLL